MKVMLLAGAAYFTIGRFFPQPAENLEAWRVAALLVCGVVFAAHFWYEHFMRRRSPRSTAGHVALAVAMGAFALAVAGMVHSLSRGSEAPSAWLLALVLWPAFTAIPAFVGALVAAAVLPHRPI